MIAVGHQAQASDPSPFWVIIDARDVFGGWTTHCVHLGQTSAPALLAEVHARLPVGWIPRLVDVHSDFQQFAVSPGQVFEVVAVEAPTYAPQLPDGPAEGNPVPSPATVHSSESYAPGVSVHTSHLSSDATEGRSDDGSDPGGDNSNLPSPDPEDATAPRYFTGAFLIFAQECLPEFVEVRLESGISLLDALASVDAARAPRDSVRFPILHAVHPQPRGTHALVIACGPCVALARCARYA